MSQPEDCIYSNIITSGEVLYQLNGINKIGKKVSNEINNEFWDFMSSNHYQCDDISSSNNIINVENSIQTKKMATNSIEIYILKLRHRILEIRKTIDIMKNSMITEVQLANEEYKAKLQQQFKTFESNTMQLILQYYQIIKEELDSSRMQLIQENIERKLLCKQAEILRDIRMFACHLIIESKGKISFNMLQHDSPQFIRCVKAVMDNINIDKINNITSKDNFKLGTKVLNVFKLQNACLSSKLQNASEKITNGKIKGLFCCLSKEYFYSFSVFGLFVQHLSSHSNNTNNNHNNSNNNNHLQDILRDHLTDAWFHTVLPTGSNHNNNMKINNELENTLKLTGSAARLATSQNRNIKNINGILRFSRYSTISNLESYNHEEIDNGLFLALCRVLVVNQLTLENTTDTITDIDIALALQQGYDCIYSSVSDEYVLLQPNYVLPEFFMHVNFPITNTNNINHHTINNSSNNSMHDSTSLKHQNRYSEKDCHHYNGNQDDYVGILNILQLPPTSESILLNNKHCGINTIISKQDNYYPLENLLLSNAIYPIERKKIHHYCNNKYLFNNQNNNQHNDDIKETNTIERYYSDNNIIINPRESLFKKQVIVESLHSSIQKFNITNQILLKEYVTNLTEKLSI